MQNKARVKPDQPTNSIFRSFCWDLPGTTGFASISFLVDLLFRNSQNSDDVDALSRDSVATTIYKSFSTIKIIGDKKENLLRSQRDAPEFSSDKNPGSKIVVGIRRMRLFL